jgi:hypothetical protein
MLKHIGKHGDRKVVVLYREVPNETHMCLLVYSDLLPRMIHDEIMKNLESPSGQQADNLAESLFRAIMADGRNVLEVLHREGFMKKIATSQVIMAPTMNAKIRLDELNTILTEIAKGDEATKRLADADASRGLQTKKRPAREVGEPVKPTMPAMPEVKPLQAGLNEALSDEAIASSQLAQATKMRFEAKSLLAEADRLEKDAAKIAPGVLKETKRKAGRPVGSGKKSVKSA